MESKSNWRSPSVSWIRENLKTMRDWDVDDFEEFYKKDVPALLAEIDRINGTPLPSNSKWEVREGAYSKERGEFSIWVSGSDGRGENRVACWIQSLKVATLLNSAPALLAAAEAALKNETYARLTGFGNMPDDLFAALTAAIAEARGTNRKDSTL